MKIISVHEAKTHLSRFLACVEEGEEIVISRSGQPVARLTRFRQEPRVPGRLAGRLRIGEDFDDPLPDEIAAALRGDGA